MTGIAFGVWILSVILYILVIVRVERVRRDLEKTCNGLGARLRLLEMKNRTPRPRQNRED